METLGICSVSLRSGFKHRTLGRPVYLRRGTFTGSNTFKEFNSPSVARPHYTWSYGDAMLTITVTGAATIAHYKFEDVLGTCIRYLPTKLEITGCAVTPLLPPPKYVCRSKS